MFLASARSQIVSTGKNNKSKDQKEGGEQNGKVKECTNQVGMTYLKKKLTHQAKELYQAYSPLILNCRKVGKGKKYLLTTYYRQA